MDKHLHDDILALIHEMADEARTIARSLFRTGTIGVQTKDDASPVTVADMRIETRWREMIQARFPDHGIIGEEFDDHNAEASIRWVLDPIDGTRQFVYGMPLFGALIGVMQNERPIIGCIEIPMTAERWVGSTLSGETTLNDAKVTASTCATLPQALLMATAPAMFTGQTREQFARLSSLSKDVRFGTDCYAYGLLASGHCDIVAEASLKPVDVMAVIPVLIAAGCHVSDWHGQPFGLKSDGTFVAAATAELHALALNALSPTGAPL